VGTLIVSAISCHKLTLIIILLYYIIILVAEEMKLLMSQRLPYQKCFEMSLEVLFELDK